jgi:hypothetical protein
LTSALARLGTPSAGAVCRAAEILRLRSRFVDGPLPLACGQSVQNYNMRTTWGLAGQPAARAQVRAPTSPVHPGGFFVGLRFQNLEH